MKIITYTAITNDKDAPRTDILSLSGYAKFSSPVMNAKIYKVLAHKFLACDVSVWLDANIFLKIPVTQLVEDFLADADIAVMEHYHKKDIYWEQRMLTSTFRHRTPWVVDEVNAQIAHYEKANLIPKRENMVMGGLIIRRHTESVARFNEAWWAEICRWSQRDQLSLPVILAQFPELRVTKIPGNIKNHPYWEYQEHAHFNT